jgi:hypothetical protein
MDLYDRLEQLIGMTRILIDDVNRIKPSIGERNPDPTDEEQTSRRCYVRAVFALVEAFAEQHRRPLVQLAQTNTIAIPEDSVRTLRQIKLVTKGGVAHDAPSTSACTRRSSSSTPPPPMGSVTRWA